MPIPAWKKAKYWEERLKMPDSDIYAHEIFIKRFNEYCDRHGVSRAEVMKRATKTERVNIVSRLMKLDDDGKPAPIGIHSNTHLIERYMEEHPEGPE